MNMNDLKNSKAPVTTVTINRNEFDDKTDNIYEAISISAKRAIQINAEIKKELLEKLEEFATYSDSLEEVFDRLYLVLAMRCKVSVKRQYLLTRRYCLCTN